ncbi:ABC transporter permease [Leucobacter sp. gxy201]|uniref:ABC transporter permease n=1 Tax=Leucobacter sp. gxy201 TaxID=2957200 RepID=UPI003DA0E181
MNSAPERYARLAQEPMRIVGSTSKGLRLASSLRDLWMNRALLGHLIRRDLKARYKDSVLGVFWSLARPLTQLLIYYLVLGKFLGAERGIPDFAIYIFTGLAVYGLFAEILMSGSSAVVDNSGLVKKVYFPREILPLSSVGSALVNFAIQLTILLIAMLVLRSSPTWDKLGYLVPAFLLALMLATSMTLVLAAMNVYLRDVQYLVEVGTMVLMWASPIVYSWSMVKGILGEGILLSLYTANPLTVSVLGFQRALWGAGNDPGFFPDGLWSMLWVECGFAAILLCGAYMLFRRMQGNFAQAL